MFLPKNRRKGWEVEKDECCSEDTDAANQDYNDRI